MTSVVRIREQNGKIVQACDVYIGRECCMGGWELKRSIFCNPFTVKKYGLETCLKLYEEHV